MLTIAGHLQRESESGGGQPVGVAGRPTGLRRFTPFGFDEALIGHAHQQRIKRTGRKTRLLHEIIPMPPLLSLHDQRIEKL